MYLACFDYILFRFTHISGDGIIRMCQIHLSKTFILIHTFCYICHNKHFSDHHKFPLLTISSFPYSYFLSQIKNQRYQERRREMMSRMERFLTITTCRRAEILSHFTSRPPDQTPKSDCCDNCTRMWVT